jgi:hypothetical protein
VTNTESDQFLFELYDVSTNDFTRLAMSFIKLILAASIEFAAYLVISADMISIKITG